MKSVVSVYLCQVPAFASVSVLWLLFSVSLLLIRPSCVHSCLSNQTWVAPSVRLQQRSVVSSFSVYSQLHLSKSKAALSVFYFVIFVFSFLCLVLWILDSNCSPVSSTVKVLRWSNQSPERSLPEMLWWIFSKLCIILNERNTVKTIGPKLLDSDEKDRRSHRDNLYFRFLMLKVAPQAAEGRPVSTMFVSSLVTMK